MVSPHPDETPKQTNDENPLVGRSFRGVERFSLHGLEPASPEFARAIVSLCLMVHRRKMVLLDESATVAVKHLDIFEWNAPYPGDVRGRAVPFFPGDYSAHKELERLEAAYHGLRDTETAGELYIGKVVPPNRHPNTPTAHHQKLADLQAHIDELLIDIKRKCARGISVPEGRMRFTDFGRSLAPLLSGKPVETGAQIVRLVQRAEEFGGKETRLPIVQHISDLWQAADKTQPQRPARLEAFNMHLRKLGIAMLEGQFSFRREDLARRAKLVLCEGHVDTYLIEARSRGEQYRYRQAVKWLQGWENGQYGSVPYGSWHKKEQEECFRESHKIVVRNRHLSYHFFNRLRMETRSLGSQLSLFREFLLDSFTDVRFMRCDNIDRSPGGGTIVKGAKIDKLFHGLNPDRDTLHEYRKDSNLWFADQLRNFEGATFAPLRHWVGVTAEAPEFALFGERYYYVFENYHNSGQYLFGYGFPASILEPRLISASHDLDHGPRSVRDASTAHLSISELIEATSYAGKLPLTLGHMSPLFGGMCNALPVGSAPVFTWEREQQSTVWRDIYGHVHWPWLVHHYREQTAKVDEAIRPLAQADREIRAFAVAGQKMIDAFKHRYAAWKSDLLPGEKSPPRMLVKAYEIYRNHLERGKAGRLDETIYIGAQERTNPGFNPFPLLNCHTLELTSRNQTTLGRLPKKGDGAGKREISLWRKFIGPLLSQKRRDGVLSEGPYELMIIGENDIRR